MKISDEIFPHKSRNLCYTVSMQSAVSEKSSHFFSIPLDIKATAPIISQIRRFADSQIRRFADSQIVARCRELTEFASQTRATGSYLFAQYSYR